MLRQKAALLEILLTKTAELRKAQKGYYRTRSPYLLGLAQDLSKQVDNVIYKLTMLREDPKPTQSRLDL